MLTFAGPECVAKEPGIAICAEIKYPDGEYQKISITSNKWDADGEEMGQLLRQLLAAMGFAEQTIDEVFGDDCDCYRELVPPEADYVEIAPTPEGETLADILASEDDPCYGCEEDCDSTACLEEQKQFSWGQDL